MLGGRDSLCLTCGTEPLGEAAGDEGGGDASWPFAGEEDVNVPTARLNLSLQALHICLRRNCTS